MTGTQPRDEGAAQTKVVVEAVRRRRAVLGWSAQRLADEMTKAGVPWNADIVVNLEHGRRRSLRVHELVALAWVLEVDSPLDLLVPRGRGLDAMAFPVTPSTLVHPDAVRAWFAGETGPLRTWLDAPPGGITNEMEESIRRSVQKVAAENGAGTQQADALADNLIRQIRQLRPEAGGWALRPGESREGESADGQD